MRRFFIIPLLLTAFTLSSCNDDDGWSLKEQINRINALVADYPATSSDFRTFIDDLETGVWTIDNWITYRNGDVWSSSYTGYNNIAYGKGSQFLDLIFYGDGTCRQCYLYAPAPYNNIPYPFLYTTLLWSFDAENMAVILTNTDLQAAGNPFAQTTLTLKYYQYGQFIMDGLEPSDQTLNGYSVRYIGTLAGANVRSDYESRYKDEKIYSQLNGTEYR